MSHRGLGLVADVFDQDIIQRLSGAMAIGHNRYSTAGRTLLKNTQPFVVEFGTGGLAVAHNGNLVNALELREQLEARGSIFQSSVDTEVIIHLIARRRGDSLVERVDRRARGRARRLLAALPQPDRADRGARPARLPAAGPGPHQGRGGRSPRRPARSI